MRFIFSKTGLALLLVLLAVLWLGGGIFNQLTQSSLISKPNVKSSVPLSQAVPRDTTPAIVRWIVETSQPIAAELRASLNSWWEGQKVNMANQLIQWLAQQQQNIASGIQTQLREIINRTLGVNSANS